MKSKFVRHYSAGDYIFREGDTADAAFIIEKGRVQVLMRKDGEDIPIANLGPGDIFGEMAIVDGLPRSATVMAVDESEISTVSRKLLNDRIDQADPVVRLLISLLLKRIRNSNRHNIVEADDLVPVYQEMQNSLASSEARERLKMENDLLQALDHREFFIEHQEILNLRSRKLVGFEALLRWQSPTRGLVRPDQFINLAEQTSVIIPLGYWVLEQSMEDLKKLQSEIGGSPLFMSINVSVRQLLDPQFAKRIEKIAKRIEIDPKTIKLEVTERVFQEDPLIQTTVEKVRAMGFEISLDDFGTGYSSLTSLFNMQVDNIKVDRTFVSTLLRDPKSRAIVQAVVAMGLELGLHVVAEGIEKEEEALFLAALGCQLGQGFLFGRPQSLENSISKFRSKSRVA